MTMAWAICPGSRCSNGSSPPNMSPYTGDAPRALNVSGVMNFCAAAVSVALTPAPVSCQRCTSSAARKAATEPQTPRCSLLSAKRLNSRCFSMKESYSESLVT